MSDTFKKIYEMHDQLANLRKLFAEAAPTDPKVIDDYAWTIVKTLLSNADAMDPKLARQLLADCIRLPYARPSKLHSALLSAGIKVSELTNDLHFVPFLKIWDVSKLRKEDYERQDNPKEPGRPFPSLVEKLTKRYALAHLLRPEEELPEDMLAILQPELERKGYMPLKQMIVTRTKQATTKDGRKLLFVTLSSAEGIEAECVSKLLIPNPLKVQDKSQRHYVNIGQVYDVLLKSTHAEQNDGSTGSLTVAGAFLNGKRADEVFATETGYVESIDAMHGHMHIYDRHSRHFVAHILRFSKEQAGDFVQFIPITPLNSRFKTAIIIRRLPAPIASPDGIVRTIRITSVNEEKRYASWELTDTSHPITELMSPLQQSKGETSPSFTSGFITLEPQIAVGKTFNAIVFLRRGKDGTKRPRIAKLSPR